MAAIRDSAHLRSIRHAHRSTALGFAARCTQSCTILKTPEFARSSPRLPPLFVTQARAFRLSDKDSSSLFGVYENHAIGTIRRWGGASSPALSRLAGLVSGTNDRWIVAVAGRRGLVRAQFSPTVQCAHHRPTQFCALYRDVQRQGIDRVRDQKPGCQVRLLSCSRPGFRPNRYVHLLCRPVNDWASLPSDAGAKVERLSRLTSMPECW